MSIPGQLLNEHISDINKKARININANNGVSFSEFQKAIKKTILPTGYSYVKDKKDNIVKISNDKMGVTLDLNILPQLTKAYLLDPVLKRAYSVDIKSMFPKKKKNYVRELSFYEKFTPSAVLEYGAKRRYNFYKNDFGGKLSYSEFLKNTPTVFNKKINRNNPEAIKINKALEKSLIDQLKNPDKYGTTSRISGILNSGGAIGFSTPALMLFGATAFGAMGLAKQISRKKIPANFNTLSTTIIKNFGVGALEGFLVGLAFESGGLVLKKMGRKALKIKFIGKNKILTSATKTAIKRGLNILGINYISGLSKRTTHNIKNIVIGDVEAGVGGLSADIGGLVGFSIPSGAKYILSSKKKKLATKIKELEKMKQGKINAIHLKLKNAQLKDNIRGGFRGRRIMDVIKKQEGLKLLKGGKRHGFSERDILQGEGYVQTIKIKSDIPKYEALLKVAKGRIRGKKINIKSVKEYYEIKRYGIILSKKGKLFAIEFNYNNGRVSHIGFKTAGIKNNIAIVKIYQKARASRGMGVRAKLKDVFVVKNKIETTTKINENIIKTLNKLETKKVFLKDKLLRKKDVVALKRIIINDFKTYKSKNLGTFLNKLYSNNKITSTLSKTNAIRLRRINGDLVIVPISKGKKIFYSVGNKGDYIELGHTAFKIPTRRNTGVSMTKVRFITKKKVESVRDIGRRGSHEIASARGIRKVQLKNKQEQILRTAIKSIQDVIKPTTIKKLKKIEKLNNLSIIVKKIGALSSITSIKTSQKIKNIQKTLNNVLKLAKQTKTTQQNSIQAQKTKQVQVNELTKAKKIKSKIKNKSLRNIITNIINYTYNEILYHIGEKRKKTPVGGYPKKQNKTKRGSERKSDYGYIVSILIRTKRGDSWKYKKINKIPISEKKAMDVASFLLAKNRLKHGLIKKSNKRVSIGVIKRNVFSKANDFLSKHKRNFLLRSVLNGYMIINKNKTRKRRGK